MTESVTFFVDGEPAPQGSKRHVGGGRMIEQSKALAPWRKAIIQEIRGLDLDPFPDGPLHLTTRFHLTPPKTLYPEPHKRKDLDKLIRAVGDALTQSGLITDDSRITGITASKEWALSGCPGVEITVRSKT